MQPVLQLERVGFSYPDGPRAVNDISVSIQKGERAAVLGRNGAGKSTFFLLACGILQPDEGCIYCNGRQMRGSRKDLLEQHRRVGVVFQEAENQIIAVTVRQEVSFGPMNLGLSMEEVSRRTQDALAQMGLQDYGERSPQELSGGEKKRVTIADILAMQPDVILLDEPTSSLDPENVARLERTLDQLSEAGIALLVSTHDVDFAARFASRALVFSQGRLLADCTMQQLFADEDVLLQAGLRRPYIYQAAQALFPERTDYPMTAEQLARWAWPREKG